MVNVYVNLIINGRRTIESVPESLREQVREELVKRGYYELAGVDAPGEEITKEETENK